MKNIFVIMFFLMCLITNLHAGVLECFSAFGQWKSLKCVCDLFNFEINPSKESCPQKTIEYINSLGGDLLAPLTIQNNIYIENYNKNPNQQTPNICFDPIESICDPKNNPALAKMISIHYKREQIMSQRITSEELNLFYKKNNMNLTGVQNVSPELKKSLQEYSKNLKKNKILTPARVATTKEIFNIAKNGILNQLSLYKNQMINNKSYKGKAKKFIDKAILKIETLPPLVFDPTEKNWAFADNEHGQLSIGVGKAIFIAEISPTILYYILSHELSHLLYPSSQNYPEIINYDYTSETKNGIENKSENSMIRNITPSFNDVRDCISYHIEDNASKLEEGFADYHGVNNIQYLLDTYENINAEQAIMNSTGYLCYSYLIEENTGRSKYADTHPSPNQRLELFYKANTKIRNILGCSRPASKNSITSLLKKGWDSEKCKEIFDIR